MSDPPLIDTIARVDAGRETGCDRRHKEGIRLLTRNGHNWANRFPLILEAVNHLKVRSCLIDGGQEEHRALLYALDLLELDSLDMRREPIETRKATLASLLRKGMPGVRLNEHLAHPNGAAVFHQACKLGAEGYRVQAPRVALSFRAIAGPAQVQEPAGAGREGVRRTIGDDELQWWPALLQGLFGLQRKSGPCACHIL
jgi:hypothetical protein